MKDAQKLAKVEPPGKWKWAASPGDGRRFSVFVCNAHIKCPLFMRVAAVGDSYYLQFKGEHAVEENTRARKNSAMTFAEEATGDDVDGDGVHDFGFLCRGLQHANVVGLQCRKAKLDPQLLARLDTSPRSVQTSMRDPENAHRSSYM